MPDTVPIQATVPVHIEGAVEVEGKIPAAEAAKEQALKTEGQRAINRLWEIFQGLLAVIVIGCFCYSCLNGKESASLAGLAGSIVTFYFVRTNHTKTGGVSGTDSR